ncbi:Hypothetical predicted protein [Cloeon dipterum]|uniref:RING-type domain-containing protein n=1 Tax=Cloeon dipterum TaxID=197152 RepID=A0A8S1BVW8_9INSE|nr:Hypothetical predicted protein [Cloeon dipterum]
MTEPESGRERQISSKYYDNYALAMDETEESEKRPYVLCELENLGHILQPLKSTQRIKYTCFGLSQKLLVFGATSGGLYIFRREPCTFLHLIPSKDGPINNVSISPDEKIVAYATSKGAVVMIEHNVLQSPPAAARRIQVSSEHLGAKVTAMQWNSKSDDLYIGDNTGKVSLLCVSVFTPKNIFQTASMQLMQLDSNIVQMDFAHDLMIISTLTRCYLSDTEKEQYKQVGQKLRDGEFGACFICKNDDCSQSKEQTAASVPPVAMMVNHFDLIGANESLPLRMKCKLRIFCARPGSRLWEVNCDGSVMSTHQLKESISAEPPSKIVSLANIKTEPTPALKGGFNFPKLHAIADKFLFTYQQDGLYIFDPDSSLVVLWNNSFTNILDAQVWEDSIYVWLKSGEMHALNFQPVEKCIIKLYFKKEYPICAQLCRSYLEHLMKIVPSARKLHFISDLADKLADHSELRLSILPLTSEILKFLPSKRSRGQKMKNGIYKIGSTIDSDEEGKSFRILRSLSGSRSKKASERSRSLSASPKRKPTTPAKSNELPRNSSSQSLPANAENKLLTYEDVCGHESPFSVMTSPEARAALQDLTTILSSKIKKQWMAFEGKMKYFSHEAPLLDVGVKTNGAKKETEQNEEDFDSLEIIKTNGKNERQIICEEDIPHIINLRDSIKSGNFEQILHCCDVCFKIHFGKLNFNMFPFKSYLQLSELEAVKNAFHRAFESKFVLNLLPTTPTLQPDRDYPDMFKSTHSDQDLLLDTQLSQLISAYGEVLDEETILQDLQSLDVPCYFMSWCSVLNAFQNQVLKFITSESRDNIRQAITDKSCPLPRLLDIMYLLLRVSSNEGIDICLSIGEHVTLRDFCYVVLKLQQHKITAGNASQNIQRYCQNILLSVLTKKSINEDCFEDVHVYKLALEAYVNLNLVQAESACVCGFPLPGSMRKYPLQFTVVGDMLMRHLIKTNPEQFLSTLSKLGQWKEFLYFKLDSGSKLDDVMPLILQLDDQEILDEFLPQIDVKLFENLMNIRKRLDESNGCFNCGLNLNWKTKSLDWTYLGQTAIKAIGPDQAIYVLERCTPHGQTGLLKKSFFQSCIFASLLSDAPSKAKKAVNLMQKSTEPSQLFSNEVGGKVIEALTKDLALQGVLPTQFMPPAASSDHHWGIKVHLWDQNCPRCSLPFADDVLLRNSGVRIFPCSHAFHVACLSDAPTVCMQCKAKE